MRKLLLLVLLVGLATVPTHAQITIPNTLVAGNVVRAGELNTNFAYIGERALNRITGGTITGNISLSANITLDGVDLSDFLLTTGEVVAQAAGSESAPAFSWVTDPNSGIYFPAADQIALTVGGLQGLLLNSSGLTVWGVNIIDPSGRIPAISSTYFTSLSGANLTALNASNISSGSLGDARLSANVPLLNAATNAFTGNATVGGTLGVTGTSTLGVVAAGATSVTTIKVGSSATSGHVLTTDASGNGTWQAAGIASGAVPTGMIALFDAACPSTWTRFSALDNKFPRGGSSYAAGGGQDTHTHTVDPAAVSSATDGSHTHTVDPASTATSTAPAHTHLVGGGTTDATDLSHTHSGSTSTDGDHSHTIGTSGYDPDGATTAANTSVTDSAGSHSHTFVTGGASAGMSHTHTYAAALTGHEGEHAHTVDIASTVSSATAHSHSVDVASTASSSSSNVPAYVQMVFCKKD
jgi:hypothetical protein